MYLREGFPRAPVLDISLIAAMDTSYLTTQVTTIIGQLHGLFDEIGVPSHERESRETEVNSPPVSYSSLLTMPAFHGPLRDSQQPAETCQCVSYDPFRWTFED